MAPNTYVLDNETSTDIYKDFDGENVSFQLVPPYKHRNNLAERATQAYKHRLKADLTTVDPNFPLVEWDRLVNQSNITLNLLRSTRSNPSLSAHTFLFGNFNFFPHL